MLITTQSDLESFCRRLSQGPFFTLDTEFLRDKTYYPKLCLVQVCTPDGDAAAIDPLGAQAQDAALDWQPFFDLLADPGIVKVLHAARQDLEIFYQMTGRVPAPIFDTQVAAMVLGYGDQIGYEALVRDIAGAKLDKAVQFTDWSRRPLTPRLLDYAIGDVTHLVKIYEEFSARLDAQGRTQWVREEEAVLCAPDTYENPLDAAWKRIKIRSDKPKVLAVLKELAAWRERQAQERDVPRSRVLKDETLVDIAVHAPQTAQKLSEMRGVGKDYAFGRGGMAILEAVKTALEAPKSAWPAPPPRRRTIPPEKMAALELLKTLLRIVAAEAGVAARLIAGPDDLEALVLGAPDEDIRAMQGWRGDLFGQSARDLLSGKTALCLQGEEIKRISLH